MSVLSVYDATRGWLYHNQGLRNDLDFWSTYSGLTGHNSWTTHADFALTKNGYTGSLNDKLIKWASDLTGHTDWSFNDNVLYFFKSIPSVLTFFKNYASIPAQTAADATLLNANLSVGSGVATFTSTSGSFTITANGYQATTANDEVLKYLIAGNRTAAQETIVIKFTPTRDFANDGVERYADATATKSRHGIRKLTVTTKITSRPNSTDSSAVSVNSSTIPLNNITYISCSVFQHLSPYTQIFLNGASEGTYTTGDWTSPAWGSYFYIGCSYTGEAQLEGYISKVAFFNRALSASEVAAVTNLL